MTRLSALATIGFSIALMLIFGWQGGTCIDEWTMASCNLAMGATLMLAGSGAYSLDNVLLKRNPGLSTLCSSSLNFRLCLGQADGNRGLAYQRHF
jgi:thiosulfate dehydrogenase [quinone] large subunit